jgi:hypothetical protein
MRVSRAVGLGLTVVMLLAVGATDAWAQDRLGGHFGVLFPLANPVQGETKSMGDDFVIGFPMGITVKTTDEIAFDLEFVPVIQNDPLGTSLTVHPGVLYSFRPSWTGGLRMAFDVNDSSWGFTPLINYSIAGGRGLFVEGVLPIRFQTKESGETGTAIGFGIHIGVGF